MPRAVHVTPGPSKASRSQWQAEWSKGGERHWFVASRGSAHGGPCLVCGGRKSDMVAHRPRPKGRKPIS